MLGCRPMPSAEPELPETRERRCPACQSEADRARGPRRGRGRAHQGAAPVRVVRDRVLVRAQADHLSTRASGEIPVDQGPLPSRGGEAPRIWIMDALVSSPRETRVRLCPHCLSLAVRPVGRVVADRTELRSAYQCRDCAKEFVFLR